MLEIPWSLVDTSTSRSIRCHPAVDCHVIVSIVWSCQAFCFVTISSWPPLSWLNLAGQRICRAGRKYIRWGGVHASDQMGYPSRFRSFLYIIPTKPKKTHVVEQRKKNSPKLAYASAVRGFNNSDAQADRWEFCLLWSLSSPCCLPFLLRVSQKLPCLFCAPCLLLGFLTFSWRN